MATSSGNWSEKERRIFLKMNAMMVSVTTSTRCTVDEALTNPMIQTVRIKAFQRHVARESSCGARHPRRTMAVFAARRAWTVKTTMHFRYCVHVAK